MSDEAWQVVGFTLKTSALSTLLILPFGIAIAWFLARLDWPGKTAVETLVMLPLFVPPVATGLVLLMIFGRHGALGAILHRSFGLEIVFTWRAVVLAGAVMSFPLLVRSAQNGFEGVNRRLEDIARTLGSSEWRVFRTITLPLARRGIVAGAVLAFARAMGEFGATVIVAGMIPRRTTTIALAIYQDVQLGHDSAAWPLLAVSVAIVFAAVYCGQTIARRDRQR
ncbi:MAG: molybdate ABC transporter permease subunit [Chthoniobacterales bacterium]|jgi:molybdate transport system permease protein|nr:molybdate ABC transporter permease subunit [Chthoniobacterales bacterium]